MSFRVVSGAQVAEQLSLPACIPLMRDAMIALSGGKSRQLPRGIIDLEGGNAFGVMPGAMNEGPFGAKLVSVFPGNAARGGMSHQGVVILFDPVTGAPLAAVDAGEITAIRTAAASAAATDVLARPDASRLLIVGTGEQAQRHAEAIGLVRPLLSITIWGRSHDRAEALAVRLRHKGLPATAGSNLAEITAQADIICTTTGAHDPLLFSAWVTDGTHLNLVGSSRAGPSEIDADLVVRSRYFADHTPFVLAQGAEFLRAKAAGLVDSSHIKADIGAVMAGNAAGRTAEHEVTIYKSLGHVVQDLAAAGYVFRRMDLSDNNDIEAL
jgi:ornithine cyclodeaminase